MKKLTRTGTFVVAGTATLALAGGGVAYAFWTTSGSGTATAAAAATAAPVSVSQDLAVSGLYPGGSQPISATITNSNPGAVTIGPVTVAVVSTSDEANCPAAANFTTTGNAWGGGVVAGGGTQAANGATVNMLNTASNQDACKGVTVNLKFTAS